MVQTAIRFKSFSYLCIRNMAREYVNIKPEMLTWAITRAGHDVDAYLEKNPQVKTWIDGEKKPTVKQLEVFADKVYIPYGFLLMEKQLDEKCPIPFFRTKTKGNHFNLNVYEAVITMQNRQHWLSEYLTANDYDKPTFVGRYSEEYDVAKVVDAIREILDLTPDWAFDLQSTGAAINLFVGRLENVGCVVMFQSMIGFQTSRKIPVSECRGFTLVDEHAPCIFINNDDAPGAKLFTLVHEFVHVLKGESAGDGGDDTLKEDNELERFCDAVAAEFLMPENLFRDIWTKRKGDFKRVATPFKVSGLAAARHALTLGLITEERFFAYYQWLTSLPVTPKPKGGSGDFYATAKKRLGYAFLVHVRNAINSNQLLYRDAYALTGYSGNSFNKLINEHL